MSTACIREGDRLSRSRTNSVTMRFIRAQILSITRSSDFRDSRSSQAVDKKEMEANEFAAELLMPRKFLAKALKNETVDLEDDDKIESLAKSFGVSTQALTFRLINLNLARRT